jgi:hypothetical protein
MLPIMQMLLEEVETNPSLSLLVPKAPLKMESAPYPKSHLSHRGNGMVGVSLFGHTN